MAAQIQPFEADSAKQPAADINRFIRKYETAHITIQFLTTTVSDPRNADKTKVKYEAFVTSPG
ncbi:hypothetical protein [Arthrobacter oryzae]|uniref:hypothetical protein n=1 Tax=Arthrobacter oryzae TaxID=409290 RepID=UPI0027857FDC|nr:hypothetical protein [Arthrobacter oryzae]MDQ0078225.1 hypothetical protein [Arthrobacter oryzae]